MIIAASRRVQRVNRKLNSLHLWACGRLQYRTGNCYRTSCNLSPDLLPEEPAMALPSDPSKQEAPMRRQNKGPAFKFLVPLVYAPVLPLIRLSLRKNPVLRDRLFTVVLAGAFAHGLYLVTDQYDIESK